MFPVVVRLVDPVVDGSALCEGGIRKSSGGRPVKFVYALQVTTDTTTLQLGDQTYAAEMGITLDTGNQTPVLFDGLVPEAFLENGQLVDGVQVGVQIETTNGPFTLVSYPAGSVEGENRVVVSTPLNPSNLSFNLGLPLFEQYDVLFNMETGIIGLRPIPEPSAGVLLGFCGLVLFFHRRLRIRRE